jgi:hypothetical protein
MPLSSTLNRLIVFLGLAAGSLSAAEFQLSVYSVQGGGSLQYMDWTEAGQVLRDCGPGTQLPLDDQNGPGGQPRILIFTFAQGPGAREASFLVEEEHLDLEFGFTYAPGQDPDRAIHSIKSPGVFEAFKAHLEARKIRLLFVTGPGAAVDLATFQAEAAPADASAAFHAAKGRLPYNNESKVEGFHPYSWYNSECWLQRNGWLKGGRAKALFAFQIKAGLAPGGGSVTSPEGPGQPSAPGSGRGTKRRAEHEGEGAPAPKVRIPENRRPAPAPASAGFILEQKLDQANQAAEPMRLAPAEPAFQSSGSWSLPVGLGSGLGLAPRPTPSAAPSVPSAPSHQPAGPGPHPPAETAISFSGDDGSIAMDLGEDQYLLQPQPGRMGLEFPQGWAPLAFGGPQAGDPGSSMVLDEDLLLALPGSLSADPLPLPPLGPWDEPMGLGGTAAPPMIPAEAPAGLHSWSALDLAPAISEWPGPGTFFRMISG